MASRTRLKHRDDRQDVATTQQCPECGGPVSTDAIETVCDDCGLVVDEDDLDRGPEWRQYNAHTERRTGAPMTETLHDHGLATEIGHGRDAKGNHISADKRRRLYRMRRLHAQGRYKSKADRNLAHGFREIGRLTGTLGLPKSIEEQACALFRSAQNEDLLRGRSIEAMATASLHGAIRVNGLSRTLDELVRYARVDEHRIKNAYQTLNTELGLPAKPMQPSQYVPRLASDLNVPKDVRQRAATLAEAAEADALTVGLKPSGFAAACLYLAAQEHDYRLTQQAIADHASASTQTIRTHRETLLETVA